MASNRDSRKQFLPPIRLAQQHGLLQEQNATGRISRKAAAVQIRLEVNTLVDLLREGLLVASPMADTIADPFAFGALAIETPPVLFTFSDIPNFDFQEPAMVLLQSYSNSGGSKS